MKKLLVFIGILFRGLWKFFSIGAAVASNLFFLFFFIVVLVLILYKPKTLVPDGAALVLAPEGNIVEKATPLGPMAYFVNNLAGMPVREETLLQDILDAVKTATDDERIKLLVISPSLMKRTGLNQIQAIGQAIDQFKESGKPVIALAENYNQSQYYLASWSDEIYLHPMGSVNLQGLGVFRLFYRELLNKLDVNIHIFRAGSFKSALEPFFRDNMSSTAKEMNQFWLKQLWNRYCTDVSERRGLTSTAINNSINNLTDHLRATDGDSGQMALDRGLVDGLKTRREMDDYLSSLVGRSNKNTGFKHISFYDYLNTITPSYTKPIPGEDKIAVIVVRGNIVYGDGAVGQIGSRSLAKKLQRARDDDTVKTVVLRIDSGGGSAFASELIRQELLLTKESGKPVVVSMGSMAASGAYWLAAAADRIIASPMTLTGSIGVFGALPTFEKSLAKIGVFNDGIGTTSMAGAGDPGRPLPADRKEAIQLTVDHTYRQFLAIVAQGRNMEMREVKKIAEGRVWDGATAMKFGLIDGMGSLEDAVTEAAELAGLTSINAVYINGVDSSFQDFFQRIGSQAAHVLFKQQTALPAATAVYRQLTKQFDFLFQNRDPENTYAHCLLPSSSIAF
ncbi:MAG: signal peptide peptidase SppA [Desulfobulbaceae bacterium]|nr:signal peptide peptidase SppA [Desulfobulbaceae bacterium]